MIEIIQQYWQSYLWTDGFQMTGVAMTAWLLVLSIAIGFVLAVPFALLWPVLDKKGWNPSAPAKFGFGLLFAGLAHFVLQYAALNPEANGLAGFWWFILAYLVLEIVLPPANTPKARELYQTMAREMAFNPRQGV